MDDRWLPVDEDRGVPQNQQGHTWVSSKGVPGHRVGRFWKFKKDEIDDWVRAGGAATVASNADGGEAQ